MKIKNDKTLVTIEDIEESVYRLDTEYREAIARSMMKLKYISKTPLELYYGTDEEKVLLEKIMTKPLKGKELEAIIKCMMSIMKGDFQYGQFIGIASKYLDISKNMKLAEKQVKKNEGKER